jgi:hypothetical protein
MFPFAPARPYASAPTTPPMPRSTTCPGARGLLVLAEHGTSAENGPAVRYGLGAKGVHQIESQTQRG